MTFEFWENHNCFSFLATLSKSTFNSLPQYVSIYNYYVDFWSIHLFAKLFLDDLSILLQFCPFFSNMSIVNFADYKNTNFKHAKIVGQDSCGLKNLYGLDQQ